MTETKRTLDDIDYVGMPQVNVGVGERWFSLASGLALLMMGLARRSVGGAKLFFTGAYLVYRGVVGHCYAYQLLDIDTARHGNRQLDADTPPPSEVTGGDRVVESSWESFPTSDPPAWTMGDRERSE